MSARIFLSPSTQERNLYADGLGNEEERTRAIVAVTAAILRTAGLDVEVGGTVSASDQAARSNRWRATHHVAVHTDATVAHTVTAGAVAFWYPGSAEGEQLARRLHARISQVTSTRDRAPYARVLTETKHTRAVAAFLELQFHDTPLGAREIVDQAEAFGQAIAAGILEHLGMAAPAQPPTPATPHPAGRTLYLDTPRMRGDDVRSLQAAALRVFPSYARPALGTAAADGVFGPGTDRFVREFQRRHFGAGSRHVDGIAGPLTRTALAQYGITY